MGTMQRLTNVNPNDTNLYPGGIGTFNVGAANDGSKILFYNESPLNFDLDFLNGSSDTLHAWEANYWTLDADTKAIQWQIDPDSLNVTDPPISIVFMTLYGPTEKITGTYPMALIRQANVGNALNTIGGIASSVENESNPAGTMVVEAEQIGASVQTVYLGNDGNFYLKQYVGGVLTTLLLTIVGAANGATNIQLSDATHQTKVMGTLLVDSGATITGLLTALAALSVTGGITTDTLLATGIVTIDGVLTATGGINLLGALPGAAGYTNRIGNGLHGSSSDIGIEASTGAAVIGASSTEPVLIKRNNYSDGTNDYFIAAVAAYQFDIGGVLSGFTGQMGVRTNTGTPAAGGIITWGTWTQISGSSGGTPTELNASNTGVNPMIQDYESVAARIASYNANVIVPNLGVSNVGIGAATRDSTGTYQTLWSGNPGATEMEVWEDLAIDGRIIAHMPTAETSSINGTTSGTVTIYQWVIGDFIYTEILFKNYNNTTSTGQQLALPFPYLTRSNVTVGWVLVPITANMELLTSGSPTSLNFPSAFTGGGNVTGTTLKSLVPLVHTNQWDTLSIPGSLTGSGNGIIHAVGF